LRACGKGFFVQVPSSGGAAWVLAPRPNPQATIRLFCFPYAGVGPSVYRPWLTVLPAHVEARLIQLPGREGRWREPALTAVADIADQLTTALLPYLDSPFAFYGHSLGALISFEVTRRLRAAGAPMPRHLFLGAHRAPQLPNPHPEMRHLPDAGFVDELRRRYDGIPQSVLENPELLELMLPCLRADFTAYETYQHRAEPPLDCAISAFGGDQDVYVRTHEVAGWREQTRGRFRMRVVPGNHFFVQTERDRVLAAVADDLSALQEAPVTAN
jgi:medium-chain acyl-[acyl-carrier-protein] hydrolase